VATEDQAGRAGEAAPMSSRGAGRRRLAKAGLGAAGVLWTTRSHAFNFKCASPSAALSSGLDSNDSDNEKLACIGRSPGYWKNHGGWPVPTSTLFGSVFPCSEKNDSTYGSTSLLKMLSKQTFDHENLGMHMVASYLNVRSGKVGFLSERTLLQMWSQLQYSGLYEPAHGVFWDVATTKKYLESTYNGS
jgi:hypothetical protein